MAILSDYQEDQQQNNHKPTKPISFTANLDPSNPLGFLEKALEFLSRESDFLKKDSAVTEIASLVSSLQEKEKAAKAEKRMAAAEAEAAAAAAAKKEEKKSNGLAPNKSNGLDMEDYSWGQSLQEVNINVQVPAGTKSRSIVCDVKKDHLKVGIKGETPIIDGELCKSIKVDDCFWSLEDQKVISILLTKFDQRDWWKSLLKGGPEIDTQKVEPEPSKLSELDLETRSTVEKMMFDNHQKSMGLPTSDQIQNEEMMKKFMSQHPNMASNMNFSGANFPGKFA